MKRFRHGGVVGKFYPPHTGHLSLIRTAAGECERVSVVVAAASHETIALADRVSWLGWDLADLPTVGVVGLVDDNPIDYDDPAIWDAHMAIFTAGFEELAPGLGVDAVFTGEDYGDELARRLGATHVRIPRSSISGTAARDDLARHWQDLAPSARVGLARRVVVVGAESTGTTTLARDLGSCLGVGFVPEYGRTYSAAKLSAARQAVGSERQVHLEDLEWHSDEFTLIASRQNEAINRAAEQAPLVIADTDALATSVWHDRYVGGDHEPSLVLSAEHEVSLYLLTQPEGVPFTADGLRDGPHVRQAMTEKFISVLEACGRPWRSVSGSPTERLDAAARLVEDPVGSGFERPRKGQ